MQACASGRMIAKIRMISFCFWVNHPGWTGWCPFSGPSFFYWGHYFFKSSWSSSCRSSWYHPGVQPLGRRWVPIYERIYMRPSSIVCCRLLWCIILVSSCSCSHRPASSFPRSASSCHHPVTILLSQLVLSSSIGAPSAHIILPSSLHHPARSVLPVIIHPPASSCRHPMSLGRKKLASLILTLF